MYCATVRSPLIPALRAVVRDVIQTVTTTPASSSVFQGQLLQFSIPVANTGSFDAASVAFTYSVTGGTFAAGGVTITSSLSGSTGSCTNALPGSCTVATITTGGTVTVTLNFQLNLSATVGAGWSLSMVLEGITYTKTFVVTAAPSCVLVVVVRRFSLA